MLEAARILGCLSAVCLATALAAWLKVFRIPALQRLDTRLGLISGQTELASRLLFLALSLSGVAAVLAATAWIAT